MHPYEDMNASVDDIRRILVLGLTDQGAAQELVADLIGVSVLQDKKASEVRELGAATDRTVIRLTDEVEALFDKWGGVVHATELASLLRIGLREAELGHSASWRTRLLVATAVGGEEQ